MPLGPEEKKNFLLTRGYLTMCRLSRYLRYFRDLRNGTMSIYPPCRAERKLKLQMLYKIIHRLADIPDDCLTPVPSFLRSGYFNQLNTRVDSFNFPSPLQ